MLAEIFVPGDVLRLFVSVRWSSRLIRSMSLSFSDPRPRGSVEKRRGLGMFLDGCAIGSLREVERQLFLNIELPAFKARVARRIYL